jgi:hypothetical protein
MVIASTPSVKKTEAEGRYAVSWRRKAEVFHTQKNCTTQAVLSAGQ